MNDLISIVIPVHNAEKYLEKCLESIISQTYLNLEIILVNDSSTDRSENICFEFMEKDKRIKYFYHNESSAGLSRNYGIDKASGEYIIFVDADDFMEKQMCEKMYNAILENNSQACFCSYNELSDTRRNKIFSKGPNIITYNHKDIKNDLIYSTIYVENNLTKLPLYAVWNGIYKLEIIKRYNIKFLDENNCLSEDSIFNYTYINRCIKVTVINDALYNHILYNKNSICSTYSARYNNIDLWYNYILNLSSKENINYEKIEYYLSERYIEFTIVRMRQEILLKKVDFLSKVKKINEILKNENLKKLIKNIDFKGKSKKRRVLLFFIKKRLAFLICMMMILRNK